MSESYDPDNPYHRGKLATQLIERLTAAGFEDSHLPGGERVWWQEVSRSAAPGSRVKIPGVFVAVYTSIPRRGALEVRANGKDAIRVCAIYHLDERSFGLAKETRVNRTGSIEAILDRTIERARSAWRTALDRPRCRNCGTVTFRSKKGRDVCSALCFKEK